MFKLLNINDFVLEAESSVTKIKKAKDRLDKTKRKSIDFKQKSNASELEVKLEKVKLDYINKRETLKRDRDNANDPVEKEKYKKQLRELKDRWRNEKIILKHKLKSAREKIQGAQQDKDYKKPK